MSIVEWLHLTQIYVINTNSLQCFAAVLGVGVVYGFIALVTTLIAVACSQLVKLKAAILDIRQKNITPQRGQEDGHENSVAICNFQDKLNICIRHHQGLME